MNDLSPVLRYLQENEQRHIQELCDYVRFPSISAQKSHAPDMLKCAEWLAARAQRSGLTAEICPTAGNPVVLAKTPKRPGKRPHFLVYGHYDVQPPEPFELWKSPPFEPRIVKGQLFARGASDNKGQHLAHLNAVEAYLQTGTELPCDLTFVIEGEEEVGSKHLSAFLRARKKDLRSDAMVISDTGIPGLDYPALTYALRGIAAVEVRVDGPSRDLHSGLYGGAVDNPAMVLCQMLAKLRDAKGRVAIPGLYDDVEPLSRYERKMLAKLPHDDADFKKFLGVKALFGESGFTSTEQRTSRPTVEINGLTSGYQGEGSKTIVPSWASAKLTFRLVANQNPPAVIALVRKHLEKICPPTVRLSIKSGHGGEPYLVSPTSPMAQAALRALKDAFQREPVLLREGGSIPILSEFKKVLGIDMLLLGLALPDDNAHSPNEKFSLECFRRGMELGVRLWPELALVA